MKKFIKNIAPAVAAVVVISLTIISFLMMANAWGTACSF